MRIPKSPPSVKSLLSELVPGDLVKLAQQGSTVVDPRHPYEHWDKLRHLPLPASMPNHRHWWLAVKLNRMAGRTQVPLTDTNGAPLTFTLPSCINEELHRIDMGAGGMVGLPAQVTNPHSRDRYLVSSLIEEAITSSQLEGAVTTREVAKRMLKSGRPPRDTSERMILNNYSTIQRVQELKSEPLTPALVMELHASITDGTLDNELGVGRFRLPDERIVVGDDFGEVFYTPPPAEQLPERMELMCKFANGETPQEFIHPVVRAIILHFWLAYDHPFIDGNGRTARALFYWAMLKSGYWLFEFVSISTILRQAPSQYGRAFLYTETDDNDLTYFLVHQTQVIRRAIDSLHEYIQRKTIELKEVEAHTKALSMLNHRQASLISHALKHPGELYTINQHQASHNVVYQTARTDLLKLAEYGILQKTKYGRELTFVAPNDIGERLRKLSPR